jgi:hypothetical protein
VNQLVETDFVPATAAGFAGSGRGLSCPPHPPGPGPGERLGNRLAGGDRSMLHRRLARGLDLR